MDLRAPVNNAIFKIQSGVVNVFRDYLINNNFIEIHTPKLIGAVSEGGASAFSLKYFDNLAFLAQSPQLYKQMAINADFDRVFEIGPVFRAEKSMTHIHLCEYVGLDLEMTIAPNENYSEVLRLMWSLLVYTFDMIKTKFATEINTIKDKLPFQDLVYWKDPLIIEFQEGVKMLREGGFD